LDRLSCVPVFGPAVLRTCVWTGCPAYLCLDRLSCVPVFGPPCHRNHQLHTPHHTNHQCHVSHAYKPLQALLALSLVSVQGPPATGLSQPLPEPCQHGTPLQRTNNPLKPQPQPAPCPHRCRIRPACPHLQAQHLAPLAPLALTLQPLPATRKHQRGMGGLRASASVGLHHMTRPKNGK
jgi:hypothetical protein